MANRLGVYACMALAHLDHQLFRLVHAHERRSIKCRQGSAIWHHNGYRLNLDPRLHPMHRHCLLRRPQLHEPGWHGNRPANGADLLRRAWKERCLGIYESGDDMPVLDGLVGCEYISHRRSYFLDHVLTVSCRTGSRLLTPVMGLLPRRGTSLQLLLPCSDVPIGLSDPVPRHLRQRGLVCCPGTSLSDRSCCS
jgi:hypothetical protein